MHLENAEIIGMSLTLGTMCQRKRWLHRNGVLMMYNQDGKQS